MAQQRPGAAPKAPPPTAAAPDAKPPHARFDAALKADSLDEAEKILERAWEAKEPWAKEASIRLVRSGPSFQRPIAAAVLARRADLRTLLDLVASAQLRTPAMLDERRLWTQAIGARAKSLGRNDPLREEAFRLLVDLMSGRENGEFGLPLRCAAIASLAELGDLRALGPLFANRGGGNPPAYVDTQSLSETELIDRATYGALITLLNFRPKASGEALAWWGDHKEDPRPFPAPAWKDPAQARDAWNGMAFFHSSAFDVYYRVGDQSGRMAQGNLAWDVLFPQLESAAAQAKAVLGRVVGPIHPPAFRLYICDNNLYTSMRGEGNTDAWITNTQIAVNAERAFDLRRTVMAAYIRMLHRSAFKDQPIWLTHGLAVSLARSSQRVAPPRYGPGDPFWSRAEAGIFTQTIAWTEGTGSSVEETTWRGDMAAIAIDYLRAGPFGANNERLAFLMGRLARRESASSALSRLYGRTLPQLNADALAWLKGRGSPTPAGRR